MSSTNSRLILTTAAIVAVSGVTLALPSAAFAAAPHAAGAAKPAAKAPITLKLGKPAAGRVQPGQSRSFTVTLSNTSSKKVSVAPMLGASAKGAVALGSDVSFAVSAIHAPATRGELDTQDGGFIGALYPKGGSFGDSFAVPAHTTYTWKVTLGIRKSWPVNDNGLAFGVGVDLDNGGSGVGAALTLPVGNPHTGGPVTEKLTGNSVITAKAPAVETLTVTNHTGAALSSLYQSLTYGPDGITPDTQQVAFDEWTGKAWKTVTTGELTLPKGLANGASHTWKLRVRLVGKTAPTAHGKLSLYIDGGVAHRYLSFGTTKTLTAAKS